MERPRTATTSDRVVKKLPAPPVRPLDHDQLFPSMASQLPNPIGVCSRTTSKQRGG